MVANFDTIKKTEDKAAKIVTNAYQESQKIRHQAIESVQEIKQKASQKTEQEQTQTIKRAEDKANKEADTIILHAKEESARLKKQLETNLDKAADFIMKRIVDGGSQS